MILSIGGAGSWCGVGVVVVVRRGWWVVVQAAGPMPGYWWVGPTMMSPSWESTEAVFSKKCGARSMSVPSR